MEPQNNKEIEKEKEILQYLYDEGYIDFTGSEDEIGEDLTLHADLTGKGLIDIFKAGSQSKEKEMRDDEIDLLEFLDDDEKSREPLPKWAKFEIQERLQKLKGDEK